MNREDLYPNATRLVDEIEAEMKTIGVWRSEELPEAAYQFSQAFAADTMTFTQWLQFVLLPRVRQIVAEQGEFPAHSMVGVQAMREFDGDGRATRLVRLLSRFDGFFESQGRLNLPLDWRDLQAFMQEHDIPGEILQMASPTPTVESAAQAAGVHLNQIVKSILFLVEPAAQGQTVQPVLVVTCGIERVNRRAIAAQYGVGRKRVKMASPDQVREIAGYEVGAMPPFGHRQPLPTLIDRRVLAMPLVYAGGGAENALVRLDPQDIQRVTGAVMLDLAGSAD